MRKASSYTMQNIVEVVRLYKFSYGPFRLLIKISAAIGQPFILFLFSFIFDFKPSKELTLIEERILQTAALDLDNLNGVQATRSLQPASHKSTVNLYKKVPPILATMLFCIPVLNNT